ncbi:MAG: anti-sigma factor [Phycisphaerales bacterium]
MITCRELIEEFLMDYVQGTLGAEESRRFAEHLAVCPSCVAYVDSYRKTIELARQAGHDPSGKPSEIPEELVQAILKLRRSKGPGH